MNTCIYDKTDKGREEIATRKYQVPAKLRTLLVMIDGRHSLASLLKNFAVLGLSNEHVDTLEQQGFIALIAGAPEEDKDEKTSPAARLPASARARMLARTAARHERLAGEAPASQPPAEEPAPVAEAPADAAKRFQALYQFFNHTIKSTIGMRGLSLQLKVEKAASVDDFRALRLAYLQAVLKAKGPDAARELRDHLDELLGGPPAADDFAMPDTPAPRRGGFNYFNLASDSVNFSES